MKLDQSSSQHDPFKPLSLEEEIELFGEAQGRRKIPPQAGEPTEDESQSLYGPPAFISASRATGIRSAIRTIKDELAQIEDWLSNPLHE